MSEYLLTAIALQLVINCVRILSRQDEDEPEEHGTAFTEPTDFDPAQGGIE